MPYKGINDFAAPVYVSCRRKVVIQLSPSPSVSVSAFQNPVFNKFHHVADALKAILAEKDILTTKEFCCLMEALSTIIKGLVVVSQCFHEEVHVMADEEEADDKGDEEEEEEQLKCKCKW